MPSSTTRLRRIADRSWFKQSLSDVEGFEHAKVGKAYLFGESRPYEQLGWERRLDPARLPWPPD